MEAEILEFIIETEVKINGTKYVNDGEEIPTEQIDYERYCPQALQEFHHLK